MYTRAYTSAKEDLQAEPFGTPINFNASTSVVARDGMALRPERWRLDNYHRAGGPVLWAHKHEMPTIGNGIGKTDPSRLRMAVTFDQEDDFATKVESKVRRKFIRGASVGWDFVSEAGEVIKNSRAFASSLARDAWYDLSELSIVNVPSDPHAVSERQWRRLHAIHPGLAGLFEDQERWDSDVTAPELRRAVVEYCDRLGLDLRQIRAAADVEYDDEPQRGGDHAELLDKDDLDLSKEDDEDEDGEQEPNPLLLRRSQLPGLLREHGVHMPAEPRATTVDERSARDVLNAFAFVR